MNLAVLLFLSSGLFLGWSLGANNAGNVFGTAVGTRMVRFSTAAAVCSVFVILGAVVSGAGTAQTLDDLGSVNAIAGSFMIALASAVTVYYMTKLSLPVSITQAVVGAIVGWNLFTGNVTDVSVLVRIMGSWALCPLLAAGLAVPLYKFSCWLLARLKLHLLRLDAYLRAALIVAGAFGSYSLGANNIGGVMGVFVPVSPFTTFTIGDSFIFTSVQQLFLLGGIAIAIGVITYSKRVMMTVGQELLALSPVAAWVVVIAHSIVLFLFASEGLEHFLAAHGLPSLPLVPVSSAQAIVGAILGLGLLRGGRGIRWPVLGSIGAGWIMTPILSAILCYVSLFVLQNVFDQTVYRPVSYRISAPVLERFAAEGIATDALTGLTGHTYSSPRSYLDTIYARAPNARDHEQDLLRYGETGNLLIDRNRFKKLDRTWLSKPQIEAVQHLEGQHFRYRWEFAAALANQSTDWQPRPPTRVNKLYNRAIRNNLSALYRIFNVVN